MENTQAPPQPALTNTPTLTNSDQSVSTPKNGNFLTILLSVLLLVSVGAAGFFAYQVQNLKKQLNELQTQPTPTPLTSPEPVMEVDDPTVDWKKYTNTAYNYEIKYPIDWTAKSTEPGPPAFDLVNNSRGFITYPNRYNSAGDAKTYITIETDGPQNLAYSSYEDWLTKLSSSVFYNIESTTNIIFAGLQATLVSGSYDGYGFPASIKTIYLKSSNDNTYFSISVTNETGNTNQDTIDQILSTFEFTD